MDDDEVQLLDLLSTRLNGKEKLNVCATCNFIAKRRKWCDSVVEPQSLQRQEVGSDGSTQHWTFLFPGSF